MIGVLDCDMTSFGRLMFLSLLVLRACYLSCFAKCTNCPFSSLTPHIYMVTSFPVCSMHLAQYLQCRL
jgi:hypothetical protein